VPEPGDLAISLPQLNVVTIGKLSRLFCGLDIVGAFEWNRAMKMPVGTDDVNAVFRHVAAPLIRRSAILSVIGYCRGSAGDAPHMGMAPIKRVVDARLLGQVVKLAQLRADHIGHYLAAMNLRRLAAVDRSVPARVGIGVTVTLKSPAPIRCFTISWISAAVFLSTLGLSMRNLARLARRDDHERDRQYGADDIHVKRDARVAGREVSRNHHLSDVPDRIAEQEDGGGADGSGLECKVLPKRVTGRYPDREVRHADLELERADLPSDVRRGCGREKHMGRTGP
jgi:hypothetical protein